MFNLDLDDKTKNIKYKNGKKKVHKRGKTPRAMTLLESCARFKGRTRSDLRKPERKKDPKKDEEGLKRHKTG